MRVIGVGDLHINGAIIRVTAIINICAPARCPPTLTLRNNIHNFAAVLRFSLLPIYPP